MSAYMCEDLHLAVLAEYAKMVGVTDDAADLGAKLHAENVKSLQARYPGDEAPLPYEHDPRAALLARQLPHIQIVKAADCYRYQSCEHDGWEKSYAAEVIDAVYRCAVSSLPGYQEAMWGCPARAASVVV